MSSVRELGENIHRNTRTMSKEALLNLIQARQRSLPILEDDFNRMAFNIATQGDVHKNVMKIGQDGTLQEAERDAQRNVRAYSVYRPEYCMAYDILHDNNAAGGLTFPQANRMFGGGAQSNGTVGIRLDSDEIEFTEYTVAFWLKMSLAKIQGAGRYKCPIGFLNTQAYGMILQTNPVRFNTNILGFDPNSHTDPANTMTYEFTPDVWQHHVLTAKNGEQCVYLDGVKLQFGAGLGQIPVINITSKRAEIFNHFSRGNAPLAAGDKMAWVSICKGIADQTWVTNDYNGLRDFSDASPVEEITTLPFMGDLEPYPNAYDGLLYG